MRTISKIIIIIVVVVLIVSCVVFLPVLPMEANRHHTVPYRKDVNTINLAFTADVADVIVLFENTTGIVWPSREERMALTIDVSEAGRVGIFDMYAKPMTPDYLWKCDSSIFGDVLTVITDVYGWWSQLASLNVTCVIRIDPTMNAILNVRTNTGGIAVYTQAGMTLNSLNLEVATGGVEVNVVKGVAVAEDLSVKASTGDVKLSWDNAIAQKNVLIRMQTTTGGVDVDVKQHDALQHNVALDAGASTGGVNLAIDLKGDVGARGAVATEGDPDQIVEARVVGFTYTVHKDVVPTGYDSTFTSQNYPASSNFELSLKTSTGGIDIDAKYTP